MVMGKIFNVTGTCRPERHYMVDLGERLVQIKAMVDAGQYFTINKGRQYGKTTTLEALEKFLSQEYYVISLDFQMLSHACFETEQKFVAAFSGELLRYRRLIPEKIGMQLKEYAKKNIEETDLPELFSVLSEWCEISEKPIVLMIDEVDSATNNQVFLDFLAQMRGYYLKQDTFPIFQSVILAGVHDVRSIKRKIRPEEAHKINSPWNIAADFNVEMSLSAEGIQGMLCEYENDHHTGMDVEKIAGLLYDYTSGYPYLVSRLCKLMDERVAGSGTFTDKASVWTEEGFQKAVSLLLEDDNVLFGSLAGKLIDYPQLRQTLYTLLFTGETISYNALDQAVNDCLMYGFVKRQNGGIQVANRIFEVLLYNYFLTSMEAQSTPIYRAGSIHKPQFIHDGRLDMDLVLKKFVEYFDDIYGDKQEAFDEEEGRRRFLLYLRPIINGAGNYYIESRTRNARRMDVVVDYQGERFVIELKIWRGNAYNERGEQQLSDYLDYFHLKKGYMLSYNFNQKKEVGVKEIQVGDSVLIEAVV